MSDLILTEEELNTAFRKLGAMLNANRIDFEEYEMFDNLRLSNKNLLSANAELSFKNQKLNHALTTISELKYDNLSYCKEDAACMNDIATQALEELKHE